MDTSQYLSMFLDETTENLQNLNDCLLELEKNPNNIDKLQEIFRVAHTIKGMAATMGYSKMTELTHKMEDVLGEFKTGELEVTSDVVTVLFTCLDILQKMTDNISDGGDDDLSIDDIMAKLEALAPQAGTGKGNNKKAVKKDTKDEKNKDSKNLPQGTDIEDLNEYDKSVIKQAFEKEYNAFSIKIMLDEGTLLKSARVFLIFTSLEDYGEIIKSIPGTEDIENENFDLEVDLILVTKESKETIQSCINGISEIKSVDMKEITDEDLDKVNENAPKKPVAKAAPKKPKAVSSAPKTHKKAHQSVRVDIERIDKLMNMVSELVINRTRIERIAENYKLNDLNEVLEQVARTTSELQDLVMKIRMLPLEIVFSRFPRMVRDLSVELGKDMELVIQGQETELDRTVIDEIGEPLIHLIRNSADHGIESKEERAKAGKDPVGKIKLIAYQEGNKAVIKVEDDGAGIKVEKIKAKAEEKGINTEGMSRSDIINLIFMQGFSTKEKVTDISGRGVGMDVVKTKIASLGGSIDIETEEGKGSSFIIKLPLTLQIIQALLVKVGTETMAISLGYVDRVINYNPEKVKKANGKEVLLYGDGIIPVIRLNKKFDLEKGDYKKNYIVIVNVGEKSYGLLVDSLAGEQEIVIKPFGKILRPLKEYMGATILGDGLVTLILDVGALV